MRALMTSAAAVRSGERQRASESRAGMLDFHRATGGLRALVVGVALWTMVPTSASAQDYPFTLLIEDGWTALQNRSFADDRGMAYNGTGGHLVFGVFNGQKAPGPMAIANVSVWTRNVPHPYFASIGPLAGLIVLDFYGSTAHLAIIDTPAGLKTTIADLGSPYDYGDFVTSGTWWFYDGTIVGGGTANDLVITGVVSYTPSHLSVGGYADLAPRVATPPFADDPTPVATHIVGDGVLRLGSFYNAAASPFGLRPVRSFTAVDSGLSPYESWAHLVVLHVGSDTYLVFSCSIDPAGNFAQQYCSISGTGEYARYAGRAWYQVVSTSIRLFLP